MYGHRVESLDLTSSEAKILSQGFQDWVHQQVSRVDYSKFEPRIQDFIEMRQKKSIERNHELGQQYLSQFTRSGGGLLTLSGLGYKTLEPGTAKKPTLKDSVEVSYRGTLVNGQLVDQTDEKNSKVILPMNAIIPGWSEGLQLIGEGGEIELVVPSELAYGESGTNNGVPPGATLHFQIRLHRVLDSGREKTT
jgi:FKBP-type peptidyl-prolyl cis-trans isomerase